MNVRTPTSATGNPRAAFTLIELMVVIAMITIAAGLIVPRMARSLGGEALREASARLAYTARSAREFALARRRTCAIDLDLDSGTYAVTAQSTDDTGGTWQPLQTSWLKAGRWPAGVRVGAYQTPDGQAAYGGTQRVSFRPDGTSSGASIRLISAGNECTIVIHPHSGRVVLGSGPAVGGAEQHDFGD